MYIIWYIYLCTALHACTSWYVATHMYTASNSHSALDAKVQEFSTCCLKIKIACAQYERKRIE